MNERIRELAEQANIHFSRLGILDGDPNGMVRYLSYGKMEEFAELIVRECIEQAHSVGDLRGVNDDMIYGADYAAVLISKYFGVK